MFAVAPDDDGAVGGAEGAGVAGDHVEDGLRVAGRGGDGAQHLHARGLAGDEGAVFLLAPFLLGHVRCAADQAGDAAARVTLDEHMMPYPAIFAAGNQLADGEVLTVSAALVEGAHRGEVTGPIVRVHAVRHAFPVQIMSSKPNNAFSAAEVMATVLPSGHS